MGRFELRRVAGSGKIPPLVRPGDSVWTKGGGFQLSAKEALNKSSVRGEPVEP